MPGQNDVNGGAASTPQGTKTGSTIDYERIEQIINSRTEKVEKSVLSSYLKEQGISEDEMSKAIESYKANKQQAAAQKTQEFANAKASAEEYKAKYIESQINNAATMKAMAMGIESKTIPYINKLADFKSAVKEDGSIDEAKVEEAIKKVIEDIPAFKTGNNSNGGSGFKMGADNGSGSNKDEAQKQMLSNIFGITRK